MRDPVCLVSATKTESCPSVRNVSQTQRRWHNHRNHSREDRSPANRLFLARNQPIFYPKLADLRGKSRRVEDNRCALPGSRQTTARRLPPEPCLSPAKALILYSI